MKHLKKLTMGLGVLISLSAQAALEPCEPLGLEHQDALETALETSGELLKVYDSQSQVVGFARYSPTRGMAILTDLWLCGLSEPHFTVSEQAEEPRNWVTPVPGQMRKLDYVRSNEAVLRLQTSTVSESGKEVKVVAEYGLYSIEEQRVADRGRFFLKFKSTWVK